jgi:threonine synthase
MVRAGAIGRDERVVAVLTGHVLKDPAAAASSHRPVEIEPDLAAVDAKLRDLGRVEGR